MPTFTWWVSPTLAGISRLVRRGPVRMEWPWISTGWPGSFGKSVHLWPAVVHFDTFCIILLLCGTLITGFIWARHDVLVRSRSIFEQLRQASCISTTTSACTATSRNPMWWFLETLTGMLRTLLKQIGQIGDVPSSFLTPFLVSRLVTSIHGISEPRNQGQLCLYYIILPCAGNEPIKATYNSTAHVYTLSTCSLCLCWATWNNLLQSQLITTHLWGMLWSSTLAWRGISRNTARESWEHLATCRQRPHHLGLEDVGVGFVDDIWIRELSCREQLSGLQPWEVWMQGIWTIYGDVFSMGDSADVRSCPASCHPAATASEVWCRRPSWSHKSSSFGQQHAPYRNRRVGACDFKTTQVLQPLLSTSVPWRCSFWGANSI